MRRDISMASNMHLKLEPSLQQKLDRCRSIIRELKTVIVAFSGGVDSSFLLALASETLGSKNVLAGMAVSTIFPQSECRMARRIAKQIGIELVEIETPQLADASFTSNPSDRCYYCKSILLSKLRKLAHARGYAHVVTGANFDDSKDYRPGSRAEEQLSIRRPLKEAGLTKDEIREISRQMQLPTWDLPSAACLATRIPYGQTITDERLARIEKAEEALRRMGFKQLRVRDHETIARVEVPAQDLSAAVEKRSEIVEALRQFGYTYVALDMEGFRTGSMNEALTEETGRISR